MNREGGSTKAIPIITAVWAEQGTAADSRNAAIYLSREELKPERADSAALISGEAGSLPKAPYATVIFRSGFQGAVLSPTFQETADRRQMQSPEGSAYILNI